MVIILQFLTCEFHLLFYYSAPWYHKKILQVLTLILSFPVMNKPIGKWYYLTIQLFAYCLPTAWITQPQAQVLRNAIRIISLQCQTTVPCFHPLTHQRTFTLIPWQPNLLRILWGGNLPKILENHGIWEWPDHPYLHAYRLLRNEYFLGTASLCKAVPILCYFVIFISLPSNSIL